MGGFASGLSLDQPPAALDLCAAVAPNLETIADWKLFDAGVRVTVNTDDMIVFGQGVSEGFLNLYKSRCLNAEELDQIRENGLSD